MNDSSLLIENLERAKDARRYAVERKETIDETRLALEATLITMDQLGLNVMDEIAVLATKYSGNYKPMRLPTEARMSIPFDPNREDRENRNTPRPVTQAAREVTPATFKPTAGLLNPELGGWDWENDASDVDGEDDDIQPVYDLHDVEITD